MENNQTQLSNQQIIDQFVTVDAFVSVYEHWDESMMANFIELMQYAHQCGLDVYDVKSNYAIRIGRKEKSGSDGKPLYGLRLTQQKIWIERNTPDQELTAELLDELKSSGALVEFNKKYAVSRAPHWPTDYKKQVMNIWKLSHGYKDITGEQSAWLDENQYLTLHEDTAKSQGIHFAEQVRIGDVVNLSRSGDIKALVRVTSDAQSIEEAPFSQDWLLRKYEVIKWLPQTVSYKGEKKGWTPSYNGTLYKVPNREFDLFEQWILKPYYQCSLADISDYLPHVQYPWVENCMASQAFEKFLAKKGLNKAALDDAIRVVHQAQPMLDFWNVSSGHTSLHFGRRDSAGQKGKVVGDFRFLNGELTIHFSSKYEREKSVVSLTDDINKNQEVITSVLESQLSLLEKQGLIGNSRWPTFYVSDEEQTDMHGIIDESTHIDFPPLNQILYGPPGTGKTYHTIEAAVKAAEPLKYQAIVSDFDDPASRERRAELQALYNELVKSGRIRFVTFHQSYGYEDFVTGVTARTQGDQIAYFEKDGVFKAICDEASENREKSQQTTSELTQESIFNAALERFTLECLSDEAEFKLTDAVSITMAEESGFRYGGANWGGSQIMKFDDLRTLYQSGVSTRQDVVKSEAVSGLARQHATYFIKTLEAIKSHISNTRQPLQKVNKQNYVLVIDEINRGNISKIFGELITLIEPSKRLGASEALSVVMPSSGETFSVPDNLYIIGTMNTADRSLAMMDTALRRRFDFIEMMPKPELLAGKRVKGIALDLLLKKLNERIEVLYDREHTLGHAFFMPVVSKLADDDSAEGEQAAFVALQQVFKNKVLPLLEEYFFEDWHKIRLVLGDNQKDKKHHTDYIFVHEKKVEFTDVFGIDHGIETYEDSKTTYTIADFDDENAAWHQVLAYQAIYDTKVPSQVKPSAQEEKTNTADMSAQSVDEEVATQAEIAGA